MLINVQNLTIETPRLILRQPTMDDLDAIHKAKVEVWDQLREWMSWTSEEYGTLDSTRDFIVKNEQRAEDGSLVFCGFRRDNGAFAISTGLHPEKEHKDCLGIGYWVAKDQQGQGFASEATNALIRVAFNYFSVPAVTIDHFEGNRASKRVIEKMGFQFSHILKAKYLQHSSGQMTDAPYYTLRNTDSLPPLEYSIV